MSFTYTYAEWYAACDDCGWTPASFDSEREALDAAANHSCDEGAES